MELINILVESQVFLKKKLKVLKAQGQHLNKVTVTEKLLA